MSVLNHVTIHVPAGTLAEPALTEFWELLGFVEVPADDIHEHGWNVRWFRARSHDGLTTAGTAVHLVEGYNDRVETYSGPIQPAYDEYNLGHICVSSCRGYKVLEGSKFLQRSSGSGRIWVGFANIRVEVRP